MPQTMKIHRSDEAEGSAKYANDPKKNGRALPEQGRTFVIMLISHV